MLRNETVRAIWLGTLVIVSVAMGCDRPPLEGAGRPLAGAGGDIGPAAAGGHGGSPAGGANGGRGAMGGDHGGLAGSGGEAAETGAAGHLGTAGASGTVGAAGHASMGGMGGTGGTIGAGGAGHGGTGGNTGTGGSAGTGAMGGAAGMAGAGGGAGAAGGAATDCDNRCGSGETCVKGVCRGSTSRWTTLGGDVHHSGFAINETGAPPLKRAWSVPLDGPGGLWPAVSDGTTIWITAHSYFGGHQRMWALSPEDGHTLWTYDFGDIFGIGQATVDGSHVYVAQCNNGGASFMYSFVASTGTIFWSAPIGAQWENYWAPLVTPAGGIYFDGGSYGGLYGFDTASGQELFFLHSLEQYDEWSPLYLNGKLYSFIAGNLRTHDPATGSVVSTVSLTWNWNGWSMLTAPVSDGDKIYLIAPPNLHALKPGQGNPDWTQTGAYSGMPAVANGVVYAISGGQLRANDAATGSILWTFAADSMLSYPPVVAGKTVYVASDANAYGFDTVTQKVIWTDAPGGWLSIAGGKLYVAQANGTLAAHAFAP